ncbi:hypothetical protein [Pseudomonas syringae]|nr:hypothetical protein [Pseudomonas syringae]
MALKLKKKDQAKNAEARWFDFDSETKILLMPLDNQGYQIALERMRRRLVRNDAVFQEGQVGIVDGERTEHENHCALLANFILTDWTGAQDESGNPLKYDPEAGAAMMEEDIVLFGFVLDKASTLAKENREERDEALGKQSIATDGKASGQGAQKSAD